MSLFTHSIKINRRPCPKVTHSILRNCRPSRIVLKSHKFVAYNEFIYFLIHMLSLKFTQLLAILLSTKQFSFSNTLLSIWYGTGLNRSLPLKIR